MRRYFNEKFTIKNGLVWFETRRPFRVKQGYLAYNSVGELVGYVHMTDDKRTTSYGYAEFYFLPEYENRYGIWHRFKSHGQKLSWSRLTEILSQCGEYKVYVD